MLIKTRRAAFLSVCLIVCFVAASAEARTWTDASGQFTVEAELIDFDEQTVILKRAPANDLIAVEIAKLSEADKEFLKANAKLQTQQAGKDGNRTWTLRDGEQVVGRILKYARGTLTIQRRRAVVHITARPQHSGAEVGVVDKPIDEITPLHQYLLPKVISHFEEDVTVKDIKEIKAWAIKLRGQPREYLFEGVILILENDEMFAVPFFLFSEEDLEALQPGWKQWAEAEKAHADQEQAKLAQQQQASLYMRARIRAHERDQRQQMAIDAFVFGVSQWQVQLVPKPGTGAAATTAVVPGRSSQDARAAALTRFPNHVVGAIRRLGP